MIWKQILEFVKLFIPKAHNRFTWIVLFIGASLLFNTWWLPPLYSMIGKLFNTNFSEVLSLNPIYGVFLIILALGYHYFSERLLLATNQVGSHPSDISLAKKMLELLNSNNMYFLKNHNFGDTWHSNRSKFIEDIVTLLEDVSSEFEDKNIQELLNDLGRAFYELDEAIATSAGCTRNNAAWYTVKTRIEEETGQRSERTMESAKIINDLSNKAHITAEHFIRKIRARILEAYQ